jgi:DNA anti-recombination protein RmuC
MLSDNIYIDTEILRKIRKMSTESKLADIEEDIRLILDKIDGFEERLEEIQEQLNELNEQLSSLT